MTTKIHLVCDRGGIPLAVDVFAGQQQESTYVDALLAQVRVPAQRGRPRCRPRYLVADKGYDSQALRQRLRKRGIRPVIPLRTVPKHRRRRQRGPRPKLDEKRYGQRNMVERLIGWLKEQRRLATRYEKTADQFLAMVKLACIRRIMKSYFSDTA